MYWYKHRRRPVCEALRLLLGFLHIHEQRFLLGSTMKIYVEVSKFLISVIKYILYISSVISLAHLCISFHDYTFEMNVVNYVFSRLVIRFNNYYGVLPA